MHAVRMLAITWLAALMPIASARADCCRSSWCPFGSHAAKQPAPAVSNVSETRGAAQSPPVLANMGTSTKRFVSNTKNLLSFKKPATTKQSGTTARYSLRPNRDEPGFFYKLFHPEPPPPPKTIDEWMSLEQIHP